MKTYPHVLLISVGLLGVSGNSMATDHDGILSDIYVALNVGASVVDDSREHYGPITTQYSYDAGHAISAALGVSLGDGYRVEVEVANQMNELTYGWAPGLSSDFNGVDNMVSTLMANAYKDFSISDKFSGYLSGGIGAAYNAFDIRSYTQSLNGGAWTQRNLTRHDDTVLAWQLGAGLGYDLTKEINLNVGWRYLSTADEFDFKPNSEVDFASNNVTAGIRYSF
jgi:opacity protein-like surface antigen